MWRLCAGGGAAAPGATGRAPGQRQPDDPHRLGGAGSRPRGGSLGPPGGGPSGPGFPGPAPRPGLHAPEPGPAPAPGELVAAVAPVGGGPGLAAGVGAGPPERGGRPALAVAGRYPPPRLGGDPGPGPAGSADPGARPGGGPGRGAQHGHLGGPGHGQRLSGELGGPAGSLPGLAVFFQRARDAARLCVAGPLHRGAGPLPHRPRPRTTGRPAARYGPVGARRRAA